MVNVPDEKNVQVLLRKLVTTKYVRFTDSILPKRPTDLKFNEAMELVPNYFDDKTTSFKAKHN